MRPPLPELPYTPTAAACLRFAAETYGDKDFIVLPDERLTFNDVEQRSRVLAKRMLANGVGKGSRVGLFFTYSTEFVVAWFAAMRIGAVAMPFSSISRPAELRTLLHLGDVSVLLVAPSMLGRPMEPFLEEAVPGLAKAHTDDGPLVLVDLPYLRAIWVTGAPSRAWATPVPLDTAEAGAGGERITDAVLEAVESCVVPADWGQVTYTSGSSALPKGVVHSHGGIFRSTSPQAWENAGMSALLQQGRVMFCAFPFFWIGGTLALGIAVQTGATVCVLPKFEPGPALELIDREKCTWVMAWPSLVQSMRAHPDFAKYDFSAVPSMGDPSAAAVTGAPRAGASGHRGMSETVGNWTGIERRAIDPETGKPLGDLEEGELVIRGWSALQGYYKKEREEVFDEDGWLHTGDRVFIHENRVWFVGRFFEMIKSQGANVAPREIELLLESFDEVEHALVFGLPHPTMEEEVTAVVVPAPGCTVDVEALQAKARTQVSSFKVPTRIEVWDDEDKIPWLATGKPDKLAVRAMLAK